MLNAIYASYISTLYFFILLVWYNVYSCLAMYHYVWNKSIIYWVVAGQYGNHTRVKSETFCRRRRAKPGLNVWFAV